MWRFGLVVALGAGACAPSEETRDAGAWTTVAEPAGGSSSGGAQTGPDDDEEEAESSGSSTGADEDEPVGCPGGEAAWNALVQDMESALAAAGAPGGAIAVVCNGTLAHATGIGTTRADGGAPVSTQTRFQWASMTKMLTGAAAVALAEDGVVDLHAPVRDVLGPANWGDVTLHQLLTHTAAYPTQFDVYASNDLVTLVRDNAGQQPWAPPEALWLYSNPGFAVAGAVLEEASGVPYGQVVEDNIFEPAGMQRATLSVDRVLAEDDYAYGHEVGQPPVGPADAYFDSASYGPMGGAWGSIEDLARWGEVVIAGGGDTLSQEGTASMGAYHAPSTDFDRGYGYGVFVETYFQPEVWSHGGVTVGFAGHWAVVPDRGFGVFVLGNAYDFAPEPVVAAALDQYAGLDWVGGAPCDPVVSELTGTYVDPLELGTITISASGTSLSAEIGGQQQPMTHLWSDSYLVLHPGLGEEIEVTFWRDGGTNARYLASVWGVASRTGS